MDVLILEQDTDELATPPPQLTSDTPRAALALPGAATARFDGYDSCQRPLISGVPGLSHEVVVARSTVSLRRDLAGCTVVILFEQGDVRRPIIVGALQHTQSSAEVASVVGPTVSVQADDDRLELRADREIVLRCGKASITLTKSGKVLIQGAYVSSRSSGVNRIKGGSVQIN